MEKKVITLDDIAERVGTSKNTVSRALRDCSDISAVMKEKVKQTAMEMGYVPNRIAGFLRSKRSNIVAVAVNSLTNPFFSICMDYCTDYMGEKGYRPLISIVREELDVEDIISCIQFHASYNWFGCHISQITCNIQITLQRRVSIWYITSGDSNRSSSSYCTISVIRNSFSHDR